MQQEQQYIPGTCNIGKQERIKRRNAAIGEGLIALGLAIILVSFHVARPWRLVLFLPLAASFVGLLQWYNKFCVAFGLKGIFNFGDLGTVTTVEEKEMLKADRAKAWRMIITGIVLAAVVTAGFYFI